MVNPDRKNFYELVDLAMASPGLSAMRPVVEKELLHHEIFLALDADGLLKGLLFQGGTSLRLCRGSDRFSEDIDFAGGVGFSAASMQPIKDCLETRIGGRFGLDVSVHYKPAKAGEGDQRRVSVDKWWVSIKTAPEHPMMPRQKIKLEIANVPAHTRELVPLRANYDVMSGAPLVLVNAESLYEIMADKVLAFPTSLFDGKGDPVEHDSGKICHRDIWDLAWMAGRGVKLAPELVVAKLSDYGVADYRDLLDAADQTAARHRQEQRVQESDVALHRSIDRSKDAGHRWVHGLPGDLCRRLFSQMQASRPPVFQAEPVTPVLSTSASTSMTTAPKASPKVKAPHKPRL